MTVTPAHPETDEILTPQEVADLLKLRLSTLRQWRYEGKGPRYLALGTRAVRYRRSEVDAWLATTEQSMRQP